MIGNPRMFFNGTNIHLRGTGNSTSNPMTSFDIYQISFAAGILFSLVGLCLFVYSQKSEHESDTSRRERTDLLCGETSRGISVLIIVAGLTLSTVGLVNILNHPSTTTVPINFNP
jgi:hypothetical protein